MDALALSVHLFFSQVRPRSRVKGSGTRATASRLQLGVEAGLRSVRLNHSGYCLKVERRTGKMTSAEFRDLLRRQTDLQLLDPCLRDDSTPYVFQPRPGTWNAFCDEIAGPLAVSRSDIRVVGSARFGFSMKPRRNLRGFGDNSDIDVVIVNADLFDRPWLALLDAVYPRLVPARLSGWLRSRRNELYTGWLTPLKIHLEIGIVGSKATPVLDFRTQWFNALKQASRHPPRRHEEVTGRLYRTWQHAEKYHLHSLAALRRSLSE